MGWKSQHERYGFVAIAVHWLSAALVLLLIVTGFAAANTTELAAKADVLRVHIPVAVSVLVLTVVRVVWWWFDRKPQSIDMPRWQRSAAYVVHAGLYIGLFAAIASGLATVALSAAAPMIFGGDAGSLPDFWDYPPRGAHRAAAIAIIVLVTLHVGAALYHQFIRRDGLISRMWFTRR